MSDQSKGRFSRETVKANEKHQTAATAEEKRRAPLPDRVVYAVPPEAANEIRDALRRGTQDGEKAKSQDNQQSESPDDAKRGKTVASQGTTTLARDHLLSVTYMDVGCWGGSASKNEDTTAHWAKKRHFGIVHGRLSVLCAYRPWETHGEEKPRLATGWAPFGPEKPEDLDEYKKLKPLLVALSEDPNLGPVVVTKAILNIFPGIAAPPADRIHVILGDLHAPVMTNEDRTYSDLPRPLRISPKNRPHDPTHTSTRTNLDGPSQALPSVLSPDASTGQSTATSIDTGIKSFSPPATIGAPRVPQVDTSWATSDKTRPEAETKRALDAATSPAAKDDKKLSTDTGLPTKPTKYPLRGRYDRGGLAPDVVPVLARIFGENAKVLAKKDSVVVQTSAGAVVSFALSPLGRAPAALVGGATAAALGEIALKSRLGKWSDDDAADQSVVEDWFDRYHGREGKNATDEETATEARLGADVFDGADADLLAWLKMLKAYQSDAGPVSAESEKPPIRLMQLGDLFDFWIGLKCPFDFLKGAREFPNEADANQFVDYWLRESLLNPAIEFLWNFDSKEPKVSDKRLATVFLYGNHDTYMGSKLVRGNDQLKNKKPLPGQWTSKPSRGLCAQHGHQDDAFNNESAASAGYLLTQAVFMDNYVRTIEDPMASVKTKLSGGMWTRLGYAEAALKKCVFDRIHGQKKARPGDEPVPLASTFVMGHTHEPTLQRIDVVLDTPKKPKISPPPEPVPLPRGFVVRPGRPGKAKVTIAFRQVCILAGNRHEPWNMNAYVRTVGHDRDQAADTLLDDSPVAKDETHTLAPRPLTAVVGPDEQVELVVQGWQGRKRPQYANPYSFLWFGEQLWSYAQGKLRDLTPDFLKFNPVSDTVTVRVSPNTWEGTKTLGCKSFLVTFDLEWHQD